MFGGGDLCDLLEVGSERKGRPQYVVCYKGGEEMGVLDLDKRRER